MIRLLAIDLDGTLLDSRWQLSETNVSTLREAHSRGVEISFVTGRRFSFTQPITSAFHFPHYLVTNAGAATRTNSGTLLFEHPLKAFVVREFLEFTRDLRPWTFLIHDVEGPREILCERPEPANPHVARYLGMNAKYLTVVANLESEVTGRVLQIVLMGDIDKMRESLVRIESSPKRFELNVLRTEYPLRDFALLDVLDSRIHKGHALAELAASIGVQREEIMAIGDNHNDLDMLRFAGFPVVMENAADELKAFGWPITGSNDNDGVAQAVERFILSR